MLEYSDSKDLELDLFVKLVIELYDLAKLSLIK